MIVLSGPWLSPHFVKTVRNNNWPLVDAGGAAEFLGSEPPNLLTSEQAAQEVLADGMGRLLTSGEHALGWVAENLAGTEAANAAELFKDKAAFRKLLEPIFPEVSFYEVPLSELGTHSPANDMYPFVVKPSVGFFSIGVHTVRSPTEWQRVRQNMADEVASAGRYFPDHMLSQTHILFETLIEGGEYAVDAYFDAEGDPVVLNILEHRYASQEDVSDRLYVSSKNIIESLAPAAAEFLAEVGRRVPVRNFPLHAEFRRMPGGRLIPIEINPLRFGGWCTTGDFAHFAWGFNTYELFMRGSKPDWQAVFKGKEDNEYALVVLDNATGTPGQQVRAFDYDSLMRRFSRPLHLSRMDFREFPLFGFLFCENHPGCEDELEWVLETDLAEFVETGPS